MQYHWLNKKHNENLIVFFCGWSFDFKPFEKITAKESDVLIFYDYSDISKIFDNPENLSLKKESFQNYKNLYLITWSMGVYTAYLLRNHLPEFDYKIAINGTPFPVNDNFGIPEKTFDLTLKYAENGLQGKFQKNLFKRPEDYQKYSENPVLRKIENQVTELEELNKFIKKHSIYDGSKFYDCAIISGTDKIIPTRNQINCWKSLNTPIIMEDSGHFPFFNFNSWEEIILKCKQIQE